MRFWSMFLGALILGTIGATAGSWLGSRTTVSLPDDARAAALAAEIVPDLQAASAPTRHDYAYGYALGDDDDYGPGFVAFQYTAGGCDVPRRALDRAARAGWRDVRVRHGYRCDEWSAERAGLAVTLTDEGGAPELTFYRAAPDGLGPATLLGTVLGVLAGAALAYRRRPSLALVLGAVAVLPGAALGSVGLVLNTLFAPALPFWTVWEFLAYLVVPLWVLLALVWLGVRLMNRPPRAPEHSSAATSGASPS